MESQHQPQFHQHHRFYMQAAAAAVSNNGNVSPTALHSTSPNPTVNSSSASNGPTQNPDLSTSSAAAAAAAAVCLANLTNGGQSFLNPQNFSSNPQQQYASSQHYPYHTSHAHQLNIGSFDSSMPAYVHQASGQSMTSASSYPTSNGMNPYGLQQRTGYDYGQSSSQQSLVNHSNPSSSSSNCSANNNNNFWLAKLQQNSLSAGTGAGGMPFQVNQSYVQQSPQSQHSTSATYLNSSQYGIYAATNQSTNAAAAIDGLHQYNNLIRNLHPKSSSSSTALTSSSTSTSPNSSSSSFSSASSTSSSTTNLNEHHQNMASNGAMSNISAPGIHFMTNAGGHNGGFGSSMLPMMPLTPDESTNSLNSDLNTSPTTSTSSSTSSCSNAYLSKAYHQHQQHILGHSTLNNSLLSASSSNDNKFGKLTGLNQRKSQANWAGMFVYAINFCMFSKVLFTHCCLLIVFQVLACLFLPQLQAISNRY